MKRSTKRKLGKIIPIVVIVIAILLIYRACTANGASLSVAPSKTFVNAEDVENYFSEDYDGPRDYALEYAALCLKYKERYGGSYHFAGILGTNFDPMRTTGWKSYNWSLNVFENPLTRDEQGNLRPGVCFFRLSEDQKELIMWVRPGMTFHDGTPVTIEDVKASMERAAVYVKQVNTNFWKNLESIEDITIIDDDGVKQDAIRYVFKQYGINNLYYVSGGQNWCGVMPKRILDKYKDEAITDWHDAIGTGPYYVKAYEANTKFIEWRYDKYVGSPLYYNGEECTGLSAPKMAYLDEITIWENEDETSVSMGFLNREYDSGVITDAFIDVIDEYNIGGYSAAAVRNLHYIAFNTKGNRPVNNKNLRKAICAAIDFNELAILEDEPGMHIVADYSPMESGNPYYDNRLAQTDYYGTSSQEVVDKYLAAAGYNGEEVVMLAYPGSKQAVLIQDACQRAGINLQVTYLESASYIEFYMNPENAYDLLCLLSASGNYSPCQLAANVKDTFWGPGARGDEKIQLFDKLTRAIYCSEESFVIWDEIMDIWEDECPIIIYGKGDGTTFRNNSLKRDYTGTWEVKYNYYWDKPSEHIRKSGV